MTRPDEDLGRALRELEVPYHGPDFYSRLSERLDQEPTRRRPTRRRPGWIKPQILLGLAAVAAVVVGALALSTMLTGNRPDVQVEVGGGTLPVTTTAPTSTSRPVTDPTTGATTGATTGPSISSAPVPTTTTTTTRPGTNALTAASTLDLGGLGPVRIGMTPVEATAAARIPVVPSGTADCAYATATGGPPGVAFKLVDGHIARIEVRPGSPVKTLSGAGIGDTEAEVQARYGNALEVLPHKYLAAGHYLTFVPTDSADKDSRLIFETDGSKVTTFRSGTLPQVALVEGCG